MRVLIQQQTVGK